MGMPQAARDWTVQRVLALPEDGNRHEVVDGELGTLRQVESLARGVQAPVLVSGDSIVPMPSGTKSARSAALPRQGDLLEDREVSGG